MAEEKLDRAQIQSLGQPPTGGFVSEIVPVQVALGEMIAIHASMCPGPSRFDPIRQQDK